MRTVHLVLAFICSLMYGAIMLALFVVHVATTFLAYQIAGLLPAIVTFFTPPFSEIWWAISTWWQTGVVLNLFTLMIIGVIALYVLQMIFALLLVATEPKEPA